MGVDGFKILRKFSYDWKCLKFSTCELMLKKRYSFCFVKDAVKKRNVINHLICWQVLPETYNCIICLWFYIIFLSLLFLYLPYLICKSWSLIIISMFSYFFIRMQQILFHFRITTWFYKIIKVFFNFIIHAYFIF